MKWIDALKAWNEEKGGKWTIPRKGTSEHKEVMELMGGSRNAGYVQMLYGKVKGRKISPKSFDITKIKEPSINLVEWAKTLTKSKAKKPVKKQVAPPMEEPPKEKTLEEEIKVAKQEASEAARSGDVRLEMEKAKRLIALYREAGQDKKAQDLQERIMRRLKL